MFTLLYDTRPVILGCLADPRWAWSVKTRGRVRDLGQLMPGCLTNVSQAIISLSTLIIARDVCGATSVKLSSFVETRLSELWLHLTLESPESATIENLCRNGR